MNLERLGTVFATKLTVVPYLGTDVLVVFDSLFRELLGAVLALFGRAVAFKVTIDLTGRVEPVSAHVWALNGSF